MFNMFKEWKTLVETHAGSKIKRLRTDNGLEYLSTKFNDLCNKERILKHKLVKKTPQQNGLVERMNRTVKGLCVCCQL